jgi:hypothetical protein
VEIPLESKPLSHKWIFKRKMKGDGTIDQYKIRLRQQEDVNYFNTYSHVPRITSVRILIAITIINKLEIHQMDIYIYIYIYSFFKW